MTAQTWIDETKNLLLTDYVEEINALKDAGYGIEVEGYATV